MAREYWRDAPGGVRLAHREAEHKNMTAIRVSDTRTEAERTSPAPNVEEAIEEEKKQKRAGFRKNYY